MACLGNFVQLFWYIVLFFLLKKERSECQVWDMKMYAGMIGRSPCIPIPVFLLLKKIFLIILIFFSFFFPTIFISWRLFTLQYCSGFCHTLTWISHGFTCAPHPEPPPTFLPIPSLISTYSCFMQCFAHYILKMHIWTLLELQSWSEFISYPWFT